MSRLKLNKQGTHDNAVQWFQRMEMVLHSIGCWSVTEPVTAENAPAVAIADKARSEMSQQKYHKGRGSPVDTKARLAATQRADKAATIHGHDRAA